MYILKNLGYISLLLLAACKVGPNFHTPIPPNVGQYTENKLPLKTVKTNVAGGESQYLHPQEEIPLLWWELFQTQEINELIRRGFANNPTLAAATAALREAQENVKISIGNLLWPAFNAVGSFERQRYSLAQLGNRFENLPDAITYNLFYAAVNVSYTLDVWGGARREIESLRAQVDYQQFQVIAAYLTLATNIVTTSISIASFKAQIEATQELIKAQANLYQILKKQFNVGGVSKADVLTQLTLLEQTKANLPPLERDLSLAKHTLTTLVGTFPEEQLPVLKLDAIKLPRDIPLSVPSRLVRQRPDVRAAEASMHAACAQIGVATANLLPQVTINGSYGWISNAFSDLFTGKNVVWDILSQVSQPLFHGGALLAQRRAAIAAYQEVEGKYRHVVLTAFQNVADVLNTLETDAEALRAQANAVDAAGSALALTMGQYRLGGVSYINLLNVQQQYHQARINLIKAQASRFRDTATLFQALGGGWWHKPWCVKECL